MNVRILLHGWLAKIRSGDLAAGPLREFQLRKRTS